LILAGHNYGGVNSKYVDRLRDDAKALNLNVTVLLDNDSSQVIKQLASADIVWHGISY